MVSVLGHKPQWQTFTLTSQTNTCGLPTEMAAGCLQRTKAEEQLNRDLQKQQLQRGV